MKTALITGGGRGIGLAIAKKLSQAGCFVYLNYPFEGAKEEALEGLEEIKKTGGQGQVIMADVRSYEEVKEMMETIFESQGRLDVLVNNAGITKDQLMLKMTEKEFDDVIDVNLKGTFNCVKHATRKMLKQREGKIVNIVSVIGLVGNTGQSNYAASKAGIIGMTKSWAREFAKRGIQVNAVAPGFIQSQMTNALADRVKEEIIGNIPLNKLGKTDDVAKAVAFLASDDADYITGQVLAVDGGMTM